MKRIFFREEVCMGCTLCEVHCIIQHSTSKDIIKAYKREEPKPISCVRVEVNHPISFAIQCQHCKDRPCVMACLSGAMMWDDKTGSVVHNSEKCMGCWTCIAVCPYSVIKMDMTKGRIVAKCDLCQEIDVPACVANCPNEALVYKEVAP